MVKVRVKEGTVKTPGRPHGPTQIWVREGATAGVKGKEITIIGCEYEKTLIEEKVVCYTHLP